MFHMQRHRRLPEEHARFYSAEISCALNFLHERGALIYSHTHTHTHTHTHIEQLYIISSDIGKMSEKTLGSIHR